jgi:predicted DNA-binding protein with PD1-like motif
LRTRKIRGMGLLVKELKRGRALLVRLDHGADLVDQISELAADEGIHTGAFSVLGALTQAEIAFYDQESHEYSKLLVEENTEIASCTGNISIRDGMPFVHAHVVIADSDGKTMGGHLIHGKIFAAELFLIEFIGEPMVREKDQTTGLYLWSG